MPKAAGYIRVSTTAQAKEGESLSTQRAGIASYCKNHSLDLGETYADEGISGKVKDRPQLTALLNDAAEKKFDYVIVNRLTRFGRSARDLVNNLGVLDDHGVRFVSLKENIDTSTPAGRLLRTVLAGIAEFEHEVITEQMLENRYIRARRGDIIIGKPPYGYTWNKEKKKFEVNPQEAEVYKRIVDMCLNGVSYKDITIALRREGIKAKLALFSATVVGQVLKNPCYYSGRLVRNTHKFKGSQRTDELKPADQHFEIAIPPLIDKPTWDRVQERIAFNKVKTKRTATPEFWLRNVLSCGECGGSIKPKSIRGRFDYYCCYWAGAGKKTLEAAGRKKCRMHNIPAQELQDRVMYHFLEYLTFGGLMPGHYFPSNIEKMLGPQQYDDQIKNLTDQLSQMRRALGSKETAKDRTFSMLEEEEVDRNLFLTQIEKVGDEIRTLEAQIAETDGKLAVLEKSKANHLDLVNFIGGNKEWLSSVAMQIHNLDPEDKQRLIEAMLDDKIKVRLHYVEEEDLFYWGVDRPQFIFNSNVLQDLLFGKINNHKPGPGGRA